MNLFNKIGEVVMKWIDRTADPIPVPKEEMDKFKASVEEGIERECSTRSPPSGSK